MIKERQKLFQGKDMLDTVLDKDNFMIGVGVLAIFGLISLTPPLIKLMLGAKKYHEACDIIYGPSELTKLNIYLMDTKRQLMTITSNAQNVIQHLSDRLADVENRLNHITASNIATSDIIRENFNRLREETVSLRNELSSRQTQNTPAEINPGNAENTGNAPRTDRVVLQDIPREETFPTINTATSNIGSQRVNYDIFHEANQVRQPEVVQTVTETAQNTAVQVVKSIAGNQMYPIYDAIAAYIPTTTSVLMSAITIGCKMVVAYKNYPEVYQIFWQLYSPPKADIATKFMELWRIMRR